MTNYRELFERLAKCNLPAGITVRVYETHAYVGHHLMACRAILCGFDGREQWCRAALMLIVDAMESRGWEMERDILRQLAIPPGPKLFRYRLSRSDECFLRVPFSDPDEVTALAECLIAALGVAE